MKKLFSTGFVVILLLNAMGYYGFFLGLHYHNDLAMTRALRADIYDASQSIVIKVPVSIPYMPDQSEFESVNGKFEHQGDLFRLIKQRYSQDTLTIVCIKDVAHKKIDQALADYVKTFTDNAASHQSSKITHSFLKDYLPIAFALRTVSSGWANALSFTSDCKTILPTFSASIVHPPERA